MPKKILNLEANHKLKDISFIKLISFALISAAILTAVLYSGVLRSANLYIADKMYQKEVALDGNIFVLGIDEKALENIGPFHTWTRSVTADIIDALNVSEDCKPAAIGIDVMFFGNSDEENDKRLVEACERYGNVVMASRIGFETQLVENGDSFYMDKNSISQYEVPFNELRKVSQIGHINTMTDSDGVIRYALQYIDIPEKFAQATGIKKSESFAYQIYKKYADYTGLPKELSIPTGSRHEWYIPYSSEPGGYSDGFSVWDLLSGDLPPEMFADTIVLIGPYTTGMLDSFTVPINKTQHMYGVEVHANIIDAMIRGEYRINTPDIFGIIILFIALFLLFIPFYMLNTLISAPIMLLTLGSYLLLAYQMVFPINPDWFLFNLNGANVRYMLPPLYLPLGIFILYILILVVNFIIAQKEKRQVTDTFKKYVDPAIIDDIFNTGMDNLQLGGKLADICVMFVDIRGFTPMSEVMSPQEVVSMLGEYLELTSSAIFKHKGTLDKFIGDATMAFWGAPVPVDDYIYKTVLAAWDIVQSGLEIEEKLHKKYGRTVSFGIGIHCGEAVVGNIGTLKRVDYTAIGNTVNTAARLESNAKPAQVLISEAVYNAISDRITARCVGNIPLKGKSEELTVYALEHIKEFEQTHKPLASAQLKPGK